MNEQQLQEVYQMVDSINLTRPKRNISRDFSDAVLMAEVIEHYNPKLIQTHNYPSSNSLQKKITNWHMLNIKVLRKLGIALSHAQIEDVASAVPLAIEKLLYQILLKFQKPQQEGSLTNHARKMEVQARGHDSDDSSQKQKQQAQMEVNKIDITQGSSKKEKSEQIASMMQKISQAYLQLQKLNEINKVKEDQVRILQKKIQKFLYN